VFKLHEICSVDSQKKIIKIVATRYQILKLKCTKFDFGWGSAPDHTAGGAYSAPPDPLAGFDGPTSKGGEGMSGKEREKGGEGRGEVRRGEVRRGEGRGGLSGNVAEEAFCLKSAPVGEHHCLNERLEHYLIRSDNVHTVQRGYLRDLLPAGKRCRNPRRTFRRRIAC